MSQENIRASVSALRELGFTEIEAAVYVFLVESSPATPYRVARGIGKPVANTYKAVETLFQKGAVLIDQTRNRLCQAVPPEELLDGLKSAFSARHQTAGDVLSRLQTSKMEAKIFTLATADQVFDRCRKMAENTESILLVDAFPAVTRLIGPWLEAAASRGVKVLLQTYDETNFAGVESIPFFRAETMMDRWSGQWLIVVADASEFLCAFMGNGGETVHNSIWSTSAFLSVPQHSSLALAFRASVIEELIRNNATQEELFTRLNETEQWLLMGKKGYNELKTEFAGGTT